MYFFVFILLIIFNFLETSNRNEFLVTKLEVGNNYNIEDEDFICYVKGRGDNRNPKDNDDEESWADKLDNKPFHDDEHIRLVSKLQDKVDEQSQKEHPESVPEEEFNQMAKDIKDHVVSNRHNMTREQFIAFLNRDGQTIKQYRDINAGIKINDGESSSSESMYDSQNEGQSGLDIYSNSRSKKPKLFEKDIDSDSNKSETDSTKGEVNTKKLVGEDSSLGLEKLGLETKEKSSDSNVKEEPLPLEQGEKAEKLEKSKGSLIDDYADVNLEQPSHMDPDD